MSQPTSGYWDGLDTVALSLRASGFSALADRVQEARKTLACRATCTDPEHAYSASQLRERDRQIVIACSNAAAAQSDSCPYSDEDHAYNRGVRDCVAAIVSLLEDEK